MKAKQASFQLPIAWISGYSTGIINIGTPPQQFNVLLDCGSLIVWLYASNAQCCTSPTTCSTCVQPLFNYLLSTTYNTQNITKTMIYGGGDKTSGIYSHDNFQFGNAPKAQNLNFALMNTTSQSIPNLSGLVGFGYNYNGETANSSYVQLLFNNNLIPSNLWAAFTTPNKTGYFQIGGYDTTSYPNLQWFPCNNKSISWTVQLNLINGFTSNTTYLVVDSGTNAIYLPNTLNTTTFLASLVNKNQTCTASGSILCPCTTAADINPLVFNLNSSTGPVNVSFSSNSLVTSIVKGMCTLGFNFSSTHNILGGPWILKNYVVFDYALGRVGIAPYTWAL